MPAMLDSSLSKSLILNTLSNACIRASRLNADLQRACKQRQADLHLSGSQGWVISLYFTHKARLL
jgi:hypothetical protein